MPDWLDLDWRRMFVPEHPILEIVLRGSFMYLAMFMLLRIFRRQTGSIGPADLLVLLLIADASQNGMAGEYKSITEGLVLVATIMGWEYAIDWLAYRVPLIGQFIERPPLLLIRDGQIIEKHLESELLSKDELMSQLRQKGVEDPTTVVRCFLEGDGHISVITFEEAPNRSRQSETGHGVA